MFKVTRKEIDWSGRRLVLESGKVARQADGAVLASLGETVVLATAVANRAVKPGQDFFPLTVNYQEKAFAAGKIPGGFFKREGRPTEKEVLTSRLIDRPIRPLFPPGFRNETQVIVTVLAHDGENDPDILGMIAASAALTISGIPFLGPVAAARIGYKNGEFLLNPTIEQTRHGSDLDLVIAGTRDAVMMVESEAKELPEATMLGAVMFGHRQFQPVIDLIIDLAQACAKEPWSLEIAEHGELYGQMKSALDGELREAYAEPLKQARHEKVDAVKAKALETLRQGRSRRLLRHRRPVQEAGAGRGPQPAPGYRPADRRPRREDGAPDRLPGRHTAARPRLGPVHPRRDPGHRGGDAGHGPGRADDRCARG